MPIGCGGRCELEYGWSGDGDADTMRYDGMVNLVPRMLPLGAGLIITGDLRKEGLGKI